ncbi:MAG: glycosyltransferase family 2 protein [Flammeovirgaceae bacterium]|nr:MAG: glycosyltransferase family 2 protein [Flammeovirgaceae bacterium]
MEDSLTIIIPVYNEEACLEPLFLAITEFLNRIKFSIHVLFVNDGSTDSSAERIEKICSIDSRYSFISLERNSGLSTALKAGIDHCNTKFIGYMDADLQTSPSDFEKLLEFKYEYELVMGYRENRKDTLVKRLSSLIANSFRQWLLEDEIIDTGCPLKIMRTDVAKQMPFFKGMHRFIPDMVILLGGRVKQVPIKHFPRVAGKAKYNLMNRMLGPLIDAFVFRWMQRNFIHYNIKKLSHEMAQEHDELAR